MYGRLREVMATFAWISLEATMTISLARNFLKRTLPAMTLFAATIMVAGCTTQMPTMPPLGDNGPALTGKVIWHDLVTPDLDAAESFYGELFGWQFETLSGDYKLASNNGKLIGGMARLQDKQRASHWLPLVSVPDVDSAVSTTTAAGGVQLLRSFDLPRRGQVAVVADPQGAAFGLVNSASGDPADRPAGLHDWLWHEVWVDDPVRAATFYRNLLGYQQSVDQAFGREYSYLSANGKPRVGVVQKASPEIGNTWVAYVRVQDVNATAAKAASLGGKVLMAPTQQVRDGSVAIIADPNGAGFVVQEWNQ
jgi:predicted enzyme related to lactoylglutathione lyase